MRLKDPVFKGSFVALSQVATKPSKQGLPTKVPTVKFREVICHQCADEGGQGLFGSEGKQAVEKRPITP
jgi:hypothetical protein